MILAVGTWDIGPFDNDTAADWCGDLNDASPDERIGLIRETVQAVLDEGSSYLDSDLACDAIAAAAVIASQLPGGDPITSSYAPDFLLEGGTIDVPEDIVPLAVEALDRIVADDSEWRELWAEAEDDYPRVLAGIRTIRAVLEP